MLSGIFTVADKKLGTFGVGGVGPTIRLVNLLTPSAQIEMSQLASKTPGTHAPHWAQKLMRRSPRIVVDDPPSFQAQFGSSRLRSSGSSSTELACQIAAGPENKVSLAFR